MTSGDDLSKKTKNLKLRDDTLINILLLGETGVGKSTFINSIANYLTYTDFKKAKKENLITLIPSKCKVQDKHGEYHIIQIGSEGDQNECLDTGMSATQDVKTYVFPIWNGKINVRLIDTPGIGDVRGIDQDNINCDNILSYIGQLHELHAICYLFKPTNPRITVYFNYCMTQILSRLDKSASKNIIFIFTNTRGTDYSPGETFPSLQKVINDIKSRPPHVDIPLSKNVFCFDNEAFRYLAAIKQNIEFESSINQRNLESWKRSVEQCSNLIKYIVGDSNHPPLRPHFMKSTSAVNEARRLVVQLTQPLAEISQLINDNLFVLQRHKEDLNLHSGTLEQLRQKLYMPVIDLDVIKLTQPVTVCASKGCAEIYKVGELNKWHYKQRCHDPCYLTNVPKEIIGSPELVNCAAIDRFTRACIKCHCDFSAHMHVYYLTKTMDRKIIDNNIQKNIDSKEKFMQQARKIIENISTKKDELNKEHSTIIKACARFAHFLQNNAITPFSDSYKEYIEYLILREQSLGDLSKMSVVDHLQSVLKEYQAAKQSFDEALAIQKKLGESDTLVTPQKIQETIQELYKLKHNGKKIKDLYECQKKSRTKEHKNTEYVHEMLSQLGDDRSKKERSEDKNVKKNEFYQTRQFNRSNDGNQRNNNQQQRGRGKSQNRDRVRNNSPPPAYHDVPPTRPYHPPPQGPSYYQNHGRPDHPSYGYPGPQFHPRDAPWSNYGYPGPSGNYRPDYSAHHGYGDQRADYGYYDSRHDRRDSRNKDGYNTGSYEFKVTVNGPPSDQPGNYPPSPGNYPPPPGNYPPPPGNYPPPPGNYPPPPGNYPSPPGNYPPPAGSYSPGNYPPPNSVPPRDQQNFYPSYPYPEPPHSSGRPYDNYRSQTNMLGQRQNQRPSSNRPPHNNTSNRGQGGFRGGRGQKTPNQKFKNVSRKKKNTDADSDSDSNSD